MIHNEDQPLINHVHTSREYVLSSRQHPKELEAQEFILGLVMVVSELVAVSLINAKITISRHGDQALSLLIKIP